MIIQYNKAKTDLAKWHSSSPIFSTKTVTFICYGFFYALFLRLLIT